MSIVDLEKNTKLLRTPELKRIDYYDIVVNQKNRKHLKDIEELRESILTNGLQQPLEVMEDPSSGCFMLLGGERRYSALSTLVDEGLYEDMIPCLVYSTYEDELVERLHMYQSNGGHKYTQDEYLEAAEYLSAYYDKYGLKGKRREWIAGTLGISGKTVQKYLNQLKDKHEPEELKDSADSDDLDQKEYTIDIFSKDLKKLARQFEKIEEKYKNSNLDSGAIGRYNIATFMEVFISNFDLLKTVLNEKDR